MNQSANPDCLRLAVVGAHLSGMPLNHQLLALKAVFVEKTVTSQKYRLYELLGSSRENLDSCGSIPVSR